MSRPNVDAKAQALFLPINSAPINLCRHVCYVDVSLACRTQQWCLVMWWVQCEGQFCYCNHCKQFKTIASNFNLLCPIFYISLYVQRVCLGAFKCHYSIFIRVILLLEFNDIEGWYAWSIYQFGKCTLMDKMEVHQK